MKSRRSRPIDGFIRHEHPSHSRPKRAHDAPIVHRPLDPNRPQRLGSADRHELPGSATHDDGFVYRTKTRLGLQPAAALPEVAPIIEEPESKPKRRWFRRKHKDLTGSKKRRNPALRVLKWGFILILLSGISIAGYTGYKLYVTQAKIIDREGGTSIALRKNVAPSELNGEGDGRVNILLIGRGGEGHEAGDLTDTLLVASIEPFGKTAAILSIPRDLYVKVPGFYSMKINAAYSTGKDDAKGDEKAGIKLLERTLEEHLGIPLHYYAMVDFTAFKQATDAVGGIDINIQGSDPNCLNGGIYDPIFDWQYGKNALRLYGGQQHLTGTQTLLLSRARNSHGGCGMPRSDFDRNMNQRTILVALKDKILSVDTFSNPIKVVQLMDAAGDHVRTNIRTSEVARLYQIGKEIPSSSIQSLSFVDGDKAFVRSASINGASVVIPNAGVGNFDEIKTFVRSSLVDGYIKKEAAKVAVLNGAGVTGLATTKADELKSYGYQVVYIGDATTRVAQTQLIDATKSATAKPYTKRYLEQRFKVIGQSGQLPVEVTDPTVDFVIILGQDAATQTTNN